MKRWYKPGPELEEREKSMRLHLQSRKPAFHLFPANVRDRIIRLVFCTLYGGIGLNAYKSDAFGNMINFLYDSFRSRDLYDEARAICNWNRLEVLLDFSNPDLVDNFQDRQCVAPSEDGFEGITFLVTGLLEARLSVMVRFVHFVYGNNDWRGLLDSECWTVWDGTFPEYEPNPKLKRARFGYDHSEANLTDI
jgi:hypothetical protein